MSVKISIRSTLTKCKNESHNMTCLVFSFHEVKSLLDCESQVHFFSCFKLVFFCQCTLCNSNLSQNYEAGAVMLIPDLCSVDEAKKTENNDIHRCMHYQLSHLKRVILTGARMNIKEYQDNFCLFEVWGL